MKDLNGWTRREWIALMGGSAVAATPLGTFLSALQGRYTRLSGEALAQQQTRVRLVSLYTYMAPPRWTFDLFLNPRGQNPGRVGNPQVANGFLTAPGANTYTIPTWVPVPMEGIFVPRLWSVPVAKPGGGTRPLNPLLQNMLSIRGLDTGNPDHNIAWQYHQLPLSARYGVAAMSAIGTSKPFAAVNINPIGVPLPLGSAADAVPLSTVNVPAAASTNIIAPFLAPYTLPESNAPVKETAVREAVHETLAAFHTASKGNYAKHGILESTWNQAGKMVERDITALTERWPALFAKYKSLTDAALSQSLVLPGVDDKPVLVGGPGQMSPNGQGFVLPTGDARTLFSPASGFRPQMDRAAATFAMTEFLLSENLSDSVTANIPPIEGLNVGGVAFVQNFDEHQCGTAASVLINSRFHLAVASCLLELVETCKTAGTWNDTVIQLASEFGRTPRATGLGSDHGFHGANVSIFSGQVKGPLVIGDIRRTNPTTPTYPGTWGEGAPVKLPESAVPVHLNIAMVAASLSTLLRVESPVSAAPSLLSRDTQGNIVSKLPMGSLV